MIHLLRATGIVSGKDGALVAIEENLRIPIGLITAKILDREIQEHSHLGG